MRCAAAFESYGETFNLRVLNGIPSQLAARQFVSRKGSIPILRDLALCEFRELGRRLLAEERAMNQNSELICQLGGTIRHDWNAFFHLVGCMDGIRFALLSCEFMLDQRFWVHAHGAG